MIRLVTYSHFINSAQFDKLDGIKVSSRADIDNRINDWKEDIGYNEVVANDINFEYALSNYDVFSLELIVKTVGDLKLGIDDNEKNEIWFSWSRRSN